MSAGWTTNTTIDAAAGSLRRARHVAILTHAKPDGDAVGSTLALARSLKRAGVDATCLYPAPWFRTFDSFVGDTPALRLPEGPGAPDALAALSPEPDVIAIVDTGSWSQVADARAWLTGKTDRAIVLDHHPSGDAEIAAERFIDTKAAAAAEIIARVACVLLDVPATALPREIAEPLYLGLATDTGFFRYSSVTPATLRLAADLLDAGADHNRVYQISEQSDRPSRLRLIGRAMSGVEILGEGRLAVLTITRRDLEETGADLEDAGGLTDLVLAVGSVRACAVITETGTESAPVIKISLRSKPPTPDAPRAADVNAAARELGGGGHVRAAGARLAEPLSSAKAKVVSAALRALA